MTAGPAFFTLRRMNGRATLQIRFAQEDGEIRPVAASTKRRGTGARVMLEVEKEAVAAGTVYVLYRAGGAGVVVVGSASRERVESALASLGTARAAYRIARIPVEDGGAGALG